MLANAFKVMVGRLSWVGYCKTTQGTSRLPQIRKGVLSPEDVFSHAITDEELRSRINLLYARDYSLLKDLNIIARSYKFLGRKT